MKMFATRSGVVHVAALTSAPTLASANAQFFDINGDTRKSAFKAQVTVDVIGGFAAPEPLTLITLSTPGGYYNGTVGWRSNAGDDFYGFDDAVVWRLALRRRFRLALAVLGARSGLSNLEKRAHALL